ncbi:MAG TPA: hypothetical protein DD412_07780 [Holosporales bacterium]|nr:hypothetical protein [Holosporales bacterium]
MKKTLLSLRLVAFLALLIGSNSWASAPEHLLEEFQTLSKKNFSSSLNIGLYFQEPTTLTITLEGDPAEKHDRNLPYFSSTFGADEAILTDLFGAFMLQITQGSGKHILESIIREKAAESLLELGGEEENIDKIFIDADDIISFVLKTNFKFERFYASGQNQGIIKVTMQNHPQNKPSQNWIAYPHPFFEAKHVGLQVLRTLFQKAHEVDSKEKTSHYFL